jgi:hypothetical protein
MAIFVTSAAKDETADVVSDKAATDVRRKFLRIPRTIVPLVFGITNGMRAFNQARQASQPKQTTLVSHRQQAHDLAASR